MFRTNRWKMAIGLPVAFLALAACADSDGAEDGANPLAGAQIDFAVPRSEGAGYDLYARMIAPYLEEELGATVIVRNEPGGDGVIALNQTAIGPTDGTRIQIVPLASALLQELSGESEGQFELTEMTWLARIVGDPEVMITAPDAGLESVDDLLQFAQENGEITFVSTGVLDSHSVTSTVFGRAFDVPVRIVAGFPSTNDAFTAVLRGDAQVMLASDGTALLHRLQDDAVLPLAMSLERSSVVDDVPSVVEAEPPGEFAQELISVTDALHTANRSIAAPPGTDPEVTQALRDALQTVLTDPEFLEDAAELDRVIDWASGDEVLDTIHSVLDDPSPAYLNVIDETFELAQE